MDSAQAAADLRLEGDEEAQMDLVEDDEPLVRQLVSTVLQFEGWSILEAANAIVALAMADAEPLDLVASSHPEAARKMRSPHSRTALARKPFAVSELVSSVGSIVD